MNHEVSIAHVHRACATQFPGSNIISLGASIIESDVISLGSIVAATEFPSDRISCDTGIINFFTSSHLGPGGPTVTHMPVTTALDLFQISACQLPAFLDWNAIYLVAGYSRIRIHSYRVQKVHTDVIIIM